MNPIPEIELCSGPGGLEEGFAQHRTLDGRNRSRIELSVEMERWKKALTARFVYVLFFLNLGRFTRSTTLAKRRALPIDRLAYSN